MTCNIYPGAIYKIPFPFTDLSETKARPALALSSPDIYGDVRFVFITTAPPQADEYGLKLKESDYDGNPLPFESYLRLDKIYPLNCSIVIKQLAKLTGRAMDRIIREDIFRKVADFYAWGHNPAAFIPGKSRIPFAGRIYDAKEMVSLVDASLDFWLTAGRYAAEFEKKFADFLGVKHCALTNSGSSANLLAFMALTSPKLGEKKIKKSDEVITVAAGFPTTVAPIIQYGAVPVFVDVSLPSYNIDCDQLESALSEKTRAVMLAHTLGNPFDIDRVLAFCQKHNLWLIEDCCDALGSTYTPSQLSAFSFAPKSVGTFGHLSTFSFYPAHHITMGEGGAVCTNDADLKRIVESFRDWGRDCWCPPGRDNTCGRRFTQQFGDLPQGYDHKYVYSHFGYNLKATDMQAAVGCAQLEKLPHFIDARKKNWNLLREGLSDLSDLLVLPEPAPDSEPSWFGFLLPVQENAGFTRDEMVAHLEKAGIQTRMLFAGNLLKHPCFDEMRALGGGYRVVGDLKNTDTIMNNTFWIGVYPGMTESMIEFLIDKISCFFKK